jgi:hypothetical protein
MYTCHNNSRVFVILLNYLGSSNTCVKVSIYLSIRLYVCLSVRPSAHPSVYLSIYLWLYSPFLGLGCLFNFLISYTVGRTPWTADQPVASRYLRTGQNKRRINPHRYRHPCIKWVSKPRYHCRSRRRRFIP